MPNPNAWALTRAQMRDLDRRAIDEFHIPAATLMENAGAAAALEAEKLLKELRGRKVTALCGPGNNGGDGFAVARILKEKGARVDCAAFRPLESYSAEARIHWVRAANGRVHIHSEPENDIIQLLTGHADLVVDALLGTGSRGAPENAMADWVRAIEKSGKSVLSLDIPSGLDADTGKPAGLCVRARRTVTFGALKAGFLNPESRAWTGEVIVADIGYPASLVNEFRQAAVLKPI